VKQSSVAAVFIFSAMADFLFDKSIHESVGAEYFPPKNKNENYIRAENIPPLRETKL
jgi:hypothetical protein